MDLQVNKVGANWSTELLYNKVHSLLEACLPYLYTTLPKLGAYNLAIPVDHYCLSLIKEQLLALLDTIKP